MSFLAYKKHEGNLQQRFANSNISVTVEPIDSTDLYYTDGDASASTCKIIINKFKYIYVPQLIYKISNEHKKILEEWLTYVKSQG